MKAILLCAGFGTRMYPLTKDRAKPLLPVAGKPMIEYLVEQLEASELIDEILVVTNARFHAQFLAWSQGRVSVSSDGATSDDNRLGAVRDFAWVVERRGIREPVVVAAGDNLFQETIEPFLADYRVRPRNLILRYREANPEKLRRTGVGEIDERDGRLLCLEEKPDDPPSEWACPALYALERDALDELAPFLVENPHSDAIGSFIAWLAPRVPVYTHEMKGRRLDVGEPEGYARAESWLSNGD